MIFIQIRVSCNVSWAAWIGLKWWVCIPYMHPHCGRSHPTAGCPWLIKMNNMPGELTTDPMECLEYLGMSKHRCQPDSNHVTSGGCTCPPVTQITYIEIIAPHEPVLMFFPIVLLTISGLLLVQGQRIFFSEANQILHSVSVCASQKMPPPKLPGTEHNGIALEYYFISVYIMWQTQHYSLHQPQFYQKYIDWLWL
jgi:hypothetical protein